jgi:hypothetical protein
LAVALFFTVPWAINAFVISEINARFPPLSTRQAQVEAVRVSSAALGTVSNPNIIFAVSPDTLTSVVDGAVQVVNGTTGNVKLDSLVVQAGGQMIRFSVKFSDLAADPKILVSGTAEGAVSIASNQTGLVLTPTFDRVQVGSISTRGWNLPGFLTKAIGETLNNFIANANGQIKPITFDFLSPATSPIQVPLGDKVIEIPPLALTASSLLVDDGGLTWIGQINGQKSEPAAPTDDFDQFKAAFRKTAGPLLQSVPKDGIFISEDLLKTLFGAYASWLNPEERARASLDSAWNSVHRLAGPDLTLVVPATELDKIVEPLLQKALNDAAEKSGVTLIDNQFKLSDGRIGVTATGSAKLADPVAGTITFRLGVSASPVSESGAIYLLPSLDEAQILKVETSRFDPTPLVNAANAILSGLATGISTALPKIPIDIQPALIAPVELTEIAQKTEGLELAPAKLTFAPVKLADAAILVTHDGLQIFADLDYQSPDLAPRAGATPPEPFSGKIEDLIAAFEKRRSERMGGTASDAISASLSWTRLAEIINAGWRDNGEVRALYHFDTGSQEMEPTEINLVEKPTTSCSQQSCSFHSCADDCTRDACDWGCTQLPEVPYPCPTVSNPGKICHSGGGDEPICAASKAKCRLEREPKYEACRLECDADANLTKATCDTEAAAMKAACDVGNEFQRFMADVGGIGKIGGDARAQGVVGLDLRSLTFASDHIGASIQPIIQGSVIASGAIDFTPYDIGHFLVCPVKGKAPFSTQVDIPPQQPGIETTVAAAPADPEHPDDLMLTAHIKKFTLKAKISPPPIEAVLAQNPQLFVECNPTLTGTLTGLTIIGKAKGLTGADILKALAGKNAAAAFTGDVDYDVKEMDFPLKVGKSQLHLGEKTMDLIPQRIDDKSITFVLRQ